MNHISLPAVNTYIFSEKRQEQTPQPFPASQKFRSENRHFHDEPSLSTTASEKHSYCHEARKWVRTSKSEITINKLGWFC